MKKRIFCTVLGLSLAIAMAGCGTSGSDDKKDAGSATSSETSKDSGETSKDSGSKRKVFYTNAFNTAPFCAPQDEAAMDAAKENNIDLTIVDGEGDANVQLEQINNAIAQGYDGIIYFPADKEGSINIIKTLNDSDVPYIVVDSKVDDSVWDTIPAFVGPDNEIMGQVCGEACRDYFDGKDGKVVMLNGAPGTDPATNRNAGFHKIVDECDNISILDEQDIEGWDTAIAMSTMQDEITRFGDKINFVFCADDGILQGATQAIDEAGLTGKIMCVSVGANSVACSLIDEGLCYGSVLHSASEEGSTAIEAVMAAMDGEVKPGDCKWYKLSSPFVTSDNIEEYRGFGW